MDLIGALGSSCFVALRRVLGFAQGSDLAWDADESFDATELEWRLLLDDYPGVAVHEDYIADLRVWPVAVADLVCRVRPPENQLESAHNLNLSGRGYRTVQAAILSLGLHSARYKSRWRAWPH